MRLKKARICTRYPESNRACRAFDYLGYGRGFGCLLGFKVGADSNNEYWKPLEPCYKPLTWREYIEAHKIIYGSHTNIKEANQ